MTRRELEQWVTAHRRALAQRGVSVLFGFGPALERSDDASWASFTSTRGSGRLIRRADGSTSVDVYAYADGSCLSMERHERGSEAQLAAVAELLAPQRSR